MCQCCFNEHSFWTKLDEEHFVLEMCYYRNSFFLWGEGVFLLACFLSLPHHKIFIDKNTLQRYYQISRHPSRSHIYGNRCPRHILSGKFHSHFFTNNFLLALGSKENSLIVSSMKLNHLKMQNLNHGISSQSVDLAIP